jgi:tRNA-specific 2-thiouridylase
MSGGVDSSVAAALLVEQGHEVIGVTMQLWPEGVEGGEQGCCGLSAVDDARRVAHKLGIRYHVTNFRDLFEERVMNDFVREYKAGRTPNPCVRCNQFVKFDALLARARQFGADYVATGHYAKVAYDEDLRRWTLRRADAAAKDQTYALYNLTQDQLARTLFPLSDLPDKADTRRIARELGLNTAAKPDSQEICFVPGNDYRAFLKKHAPETVQPGELVDTEGNPVGEHEGVAFYTRGQRKGIGAHGPEPHYVVDIKPKSNQVVIGLGPKLFSRRFEVVEMNWIAYSGVDALPEGITAKIRYNMTDRPCGLSEVNGRLVGEYAAPERAITPGQSAVFYRGDLVVGGGRVEEWSDPGNPSRLP